MNASFQRRVMELFDEVCDLPPPERSTALDARCRGASELRVAVERMLELDDGAAGDWDPGRGAAILAERLDDDAVPERIGAYRVHRVLGRGGMGVVYEAEQEDPRRPVALKVVRTDLVAPDAVRRFRHEAQILGRLQHPGIAQILEAGWAEIHGTRRPYFAMEFVEGRSLARHADDAGLGLEDRLELLARVADAVQHAHRKGVIHRDLKPANILVTDVPGDPVGRPKVLDFGVARLIDARDAEVSFQTQPGAIIGTLAYMSPEQLAGRVDEVDSRADVYALGALLHELLAGSPPHELTGCSLLDAARVVTERDVPRLGGRVAGARGDVETIVATALERDLDRRYGSASDLAAEIRRFLRGEPIEASPATTFHQLRVFARRNRALVLGVSGTLALLVFSVVVLSVALGLVSRERRVAEQAERRQAAVAEFQATILSRLEVAPLADAIRGELLREVEPTAPAGAPDLLRSRVESIDAARIASVAFESAIVARAGEVLDSGYTDDPVVEADLRGVLGRLYESLGRLPEAFDQWIEAHAVCRAAFGVEDPRTLERLPGAIEALRRGGRLDEGVALADEGLAILGGTVDPRDPLVLRLRRERLAFETDRLLVLEPLRALVADYERTPGARGEGWVGAIRALAMAENKEGDPEAAFALWERYDIPRLEAGHDEDDLLQSGYHIATGFYEHGRPGRAADIAGIIHESGARRYGPTRLVVFRWGAFEARAAADAGRTAESDAAFASLVATIREGFAPGSPAAIELAASLTRQMALVGRYEAARSLLAELAEERSALGVAAGDPGLRQLEKAREAVEILRERAERGSTGPG